MRHKFVRRMTFALVLLFSVSLCFNEAGAQRKRNKRSRRVTNPVAVTPITEPMQPTTEPQIISTADQQANEQGNAPDTSGQPQNTSRRTNRNRPAAAPAPQESDEYS